MLSYEELKLKPKTLRAMTSLRPSEFDALLDDFSAAWNDVAGSDPSKGGRPPVITAMADRLLFILFYLKTYPLQEVIAHLFGLSQPQANFLIHQLADVLGKALGAGATDPHDSPTRCWPGWRRNCRRTLASTAPSGASSAR